MARTKKTKTQRIEDLLAKGKSVPEIVKATKAHPSMVYAIRSKQRKSQVASFQNEIKPGEIYIVTEQSIWQRIANIICFWR